MLSQDEYDTVAPKIYAPEEFRDLDATLMDGLEEYPWEPEQQQE